ncbi:MAG TPA: c-type cytochrome [Solirubrobacterales bacterium]|jgi:mono/diheme cytochrome c family protein
MTVPKFPQALILFVILALAGAIVVAGCGSNSSTTTEPAAEEAAPPAEEKEAEEEPAEEEPAEEAEEEEPAEEGGGQEGGGEAAMVVEGKTVFTTNCGSCHTLKAAGTSGELGPNLDELKPADAIVEKQVTNGGGPMPAFGKQGILTPEEIKAVAAFVSTEAGK